MYAPQLRIFAAVAPPGLAPPGPLAPIAPPASALSKPARRPARPQKKPQKNTVVLRVVSFAAACAEVGLPGVSKTAREVCRLLSETTRPVTALDTAASPEQAAQWAETFGSGNLLVYALHASSENDPQYLAVGVTRGCVVDGLGVSGAWEVLTALGGADNAFTRLALEHRDAPLSNANMHDALFRWSSTPRKRPLSALLHAPCFVKPYLGKLRSVYAAVEKARREGRALEYTPPTRAVLLLELLVSFSEESKRLFLHLVGQPPRV